MCVKYCICLGGVFDTQLNTQDRVLPFTKNTNQKYCVVVTKTAIIYCSIIKNKTYENKHLIRCFLTVSNIHTVGMPATTPLLGLMLDVANEVGPIVEVPAHQAVRIRRIKPRLLDVSSRYGPAQSFGVLLCRAGPSLGQLVVSSATLTLHAQGLLEGYVASKESGRLLRRCLTLCVFG